MLINAIQGKGMIRKPEVVYIMKTSRIEESVKFYTIPVRGCSYLKEGFSVGSRPGPESMMLS